MISYVHIYIYLYIRILYMYIYIGFLKGFLPRHLL